MSGDLVFVSAGPVGIHYARCEPCMCAAHPGGPHPWAGPDDIEYARSTGQPASATDGRCACYCYYEPENTTEPDWSESESITADPCPLCGEPTACGYDAEGRALIHALGEDDE